MRPLPPKTRQARLRSRALLATVVLFVAASCGGEKTPASNGSKAVPTAPPFASVPSPTIVTGGATPTAVASGTPGAGGAVGEQIHVVVAGDVLSGLADKYDVPSAQIRTLNNLTTDTLQIGQRIRIPARTAPAPTPTTAPGVRTHKVVEGDTALGIALKYDTSVEALERTNNVSKGGLDDLQLGRILNLPPPGQR